VRIVLALKSIKHNINPVHLVKKEQSSAEYSAKNPHHMLPSLVTSDGMTINQSLAIIEYLEGAYPDTTSIFPDTEVGKAKAREYFLHIATDIQPLQNLRVLLKIQADQSKEARFAWGEHWIKHGFAALEKQLSQTAGLYCIGDNVTLADIALVPQVYNARRFKIDVKTLYPTIYAIEERLSKLPKFIEAHPDGQIDAQKPN
jgi:maleylacetoacetate isomerase